MVVLRPFVEAHVRWRNGYTKFLVEVRAEVVCDVNTASPYFWWKANSSIYYIIQYSGNISLVDATRMQLGLASEAWYVASPGMSPRTQGFFL